MIYCPRIVLKWDWIRIHHQLIRCSATPFAVLSSQVICDVELALLLFVYAVYIQYVKVDARRMAEGQIQMSIQHIIMDARRMTEGQTQMNYRSLKNRIPQYEDMVLKNQQR